MCTILDADCFFSIVLSHIDSIDISRIITIRNSIQSQKSDIVINVSGEAIHRAATYYPSFFKLEESKICRGSRFRTDTILQFVKREFSNEVSETVLDQVDQLVSRSISGP